MAMDEKQLDAYWRDGFVVLHGLLDRASLRPWLERLDAIVAGVFEPAEGMLLMRDVMVAKGAVAARSRAEAIAKIQDYHNDPVLYSYVLDERILGSIEPIVGSDPWSVHTMLINKPPNVDGRHPFHQDLLYFPFRPADNIVATWTALEPVTRENGCLQVIPRSHRGELLEHENPDWEWLNLAYFGAKGVGPDNERLHLEMEPGDTVLFHPLLLHGSGRNRTPGFRRAISAHYASAECLRSWSEERFGERPYRKVREDASLEGDPSD